MYRIIDSRTGVDLRPWLKFDTQEDAWREITDMQNRWNEHGGDSGFNYDQLLNIKLAVVAE